MKANRPNYSLTPPPPTHTHRSMLSLFIGYTVNLILISSHVYIDTLLFKNRLQQVVPPVQVITEPKLTMTNI